VQELLGYREFSMTLRYPDRLREAVAVLEGFSTNQRKAVKSTASVS